jgi:uncharacterized protein YsxB (DUF464 family)
VEPLERPEPLNSVGINPVMAMIAVKATRNEKGLIDGFSVRGHAEYADEGNDVVCAAVSALLQAALLGLEEIEKLTFDYRVRKSFLEFRLPELSRGYRAERVNFLMSTVYASLKRIEERYPEFIHVEEVLPQIGKNKGSDRKRLDADAEGRTDRKSAH